MSVERFEYEVVLYPGTEREMVCLVSSPASARDLIRLMEPETFVCRKVETPHGNGFIVMRRSKIDGANTPVTVFLDKAKAAVYATKQGEADAAGEYYVTWTLIRK